MRMQSLAKVKTAILSRATAGTRGRRLIVNLPGKPRPCASAWRFLRPPSAKAWRICAAKIRTRQPSDRIMSDNPATNSRRPMDTFGRMVDYLRISVTDRCNERCLYCMPEGYKGWERKPDHLTADEIIRVVRVAAGMGFRKFRLTGGEPLVRARRAGDRARAWRPFPAWSASGFPPTARSLAALAQPLRDAGVRTVNVSLDALDPAIYRRITGGDVNAVLAGHSRRGGGGL